MHCYQHVAVFQSDNNIGILNLVSQAEQSANIQKPTVLYRLIHPVKEIFEAKWFLTTNGELIVVSFVTKS